MPEEVYRFRAELDTTAMQAQMGQMQAQMSGQLTQMIQPVTQAANFSHQMGAQSILAAQDMARRAHMSAGMSGSAAPSFAGGMGYSPGFMGLAANSMGLNPMGSYAYTPMEMQYMAGRELSDRITGATASTVRGVSSIVGETAAGFVGGSIGSTIGAGIGGTLGALAPIPFGAGIGSFIGGMIGGTKGYNAGAAVGSAAYGPMGLAAMGAMAAGAPGAAIGAAIGAPLQVGIETYGRTQEMRDFLRSNAGLMPFGQSSNLMGVGFSRAQETAIADQVQSAAAHDTRFGSTSQAFSAYKGVMEAGVQGDFYQGAHTAEKFTARTRELIDAVKSIQTTLHKSWEESVEVMKQMSNLGVTRQGQMESVALTARTTASLTGRDPNQVFAGMMGGAANVRGTYMLGVQGAEMHAQAQGATAMMAQGGMVRGLQGQDLTQQFMAAAGGREAVADQIQRATTRYAASDQFETLLQAAFDPATGQIDRGVLERGKRGDISVVDLQSRAAKNMHQQGMTVWEAAQTFEENRAEIMEAAGPGAAMRSMRTQAMKQAMRHNGRVTRAGFMRAAEGMGFMEGMSPQAGRLLGENLWNLDQIEAQQEDAQQFNEYRQLEGRRMREAGILPAMRRFGRDVAGGAIDMAIGARQATIDPLARGFNKWYMQDFLGVRPAPAPFTLTGEDFGQYAAGRPAPASAPGALIDITGSDRGYADFGRAPTGREMAQGRFAAPDTSYLDDISAGLGAFFSGGQNVMGQDYNTRVAIQAGDISSYQTPEGTVQRIHQDQLSNRAQINAAAGQQTYVVGTDGEDRYMLTTNQDAIRKSMSRENVLLGEMAGGAAGARSAGMSEENRATMDAVDQTWAIYGKKSMTDLAMRGSYTDSQGVFHTGGGMQTAVGAIMERMGGDVQGNREFAEAVIAKRLGMELTPEQQKALAQSSPAYLSSLTSEQTRERYQEAKVGLTDAFRAIGGDAAAAAFEANEGQSIKMLEQARKDLSSSDGTGEVDVTKLLVAAGVTDKYRNRLEGVSEEDYKSALAQANRIVDGQEALRDGIAKDGTLADPEGLFHTTEAGIEAYKTHRSRITDDTITDRIADMFSKGKTRDTKGLDIYDKVAAAQARTKGVGGGTGLDLVDTLDLLNESAEKRKEKGLDISDADIEKVFENNVRLKETLTAADKLVGLQDTDRFQKMGADERKKAIEHLLQNEAPEMREEQISVISEQFEKQFEGLKEGEIGKVKKVDAKNIQRLVQGVAAAEGRQAGAGGLDPKVLAASLGDFPKHMVDFANSINSLAEKTNKLADKL